MSIEEALRVAEKVLDPDALFPCLDTPFSKYSKTNYGASIGEIPTIRKIISQRDEQIDDIDTITRRMRTMLRKLHEKRRQIILSMIMHQGFIKGMRRLPLEILKEIFIHCLPTGMHVEPAAHAAPLVLMRVCRSWREVAIDTPRLWSSLYMKEPEQRVTLWHDWLRNAKNSQLALKVNVFSPFGNPGWRKAALEFLRFYSSRLIDISVRFDKFEGLDLLFGNVPILERLCLAGDMRTVLGASTEMISIIQPQPRLRTLTILSPPFHVVTLSIFNPGWKNLTRLAIVFKFEFGEHNRHLIFPTLLKMCPNLEHFDISPVVILEEDSLASLTHPKLRVLDVGDVNWKGSSVDTLTLPNLRHLRIGHHDYETPPSFDDMLIREQSPREGKRHRPFDINIATDIDYRKVQHLCKVLDPGWTELTHLRMGFNAQYDYFFHVLEHCPNLEALTVSSIRVVGDTPSQPITHPILRSLSINATGPYHKLLDTLTLPSLCHFELIVPGGGQNWPHANFKAFLCRSQCPLKTLKIKGPRISVEQRDEFSSLTCCR